MMISAMMISRRNFLAGTAAIIATEAKAVNLTGKVLIPRKVTGPVQTPGAFSLVTGIANGAYTGYPQAVSVGTSSFIPSVNNNGTQWLYEVSNSSGVVLNSIQLSAAYSGIQDDHMEPAIISTPTAALLAAYCDHNTDSVIRFRRSSAGTIAGFGTEYTVATSGATTYPQMFKHAATGDLYLIYRSTQTQWAIMKSTNDGLAWTVLGSFVTDAQQMYCTGYWSGPNTLRLFANFNQTLDNSIIYIAELNVSTGDLVSGGGTLSNMYTGTPAFPSAMASWSALITPGTGKAAAIQSVALNGDLLYTVVTNDQQYAEYWYASFTVGNQFTTANWAKTKITDGMYGVGDNDPGGNYRWAGRHTLSYEAGLIYPRVYASRDARGRFYIERWDAQDVHGTSPWLCTMFYDSMLMGLSDAVQRPQGIFGSGDSLPFYNMKGTYHGYTIFSTAIEWPIITAQGNRAPPITNATSFSVAEQKALEILLTASEPAGWRISGGADAALFFCTGDRLYLQAKQYLSPIDANADNVYDVQLTATSISKQSSTINISVTITQAAYAPANMLLWSQVYTNAVWTPSGVTLSQNTADVLDPLGTNLSCKIIQTTGTVVHRVQQTVSVTSGQTYTLSSYFHSGTSPFGALNLFDGVTSYGGTFDFLRGNFVAPKDSGGALLAHGMQSVANGWYRAWITATVGNTSAAAAAQIINKAIAGSAQSEAGVVTNVDYFFGSQLNIGAMGDYAARTT